MNKYYELLHNIFVPVSLLNFELPKIGTEKLYET